MKKVALVFILAVLAPSLVLAWLALRSLQDQQLVLERQESLLCQGLAETIARSCASLLLQREQDFSQQVETILAHETPDHAANEFDSLIRTNWKTANVGFAVTLSGTIFSPTLFERGESRRFRLQNDKFLCGREPVEVWYASPKGNNASPQSDSNETAQTFALNNSQSPLGQNSFPPQQAYANAKPQKRIVVPQTEPGEGGQSVSKAVTAEADFRQLASEVRDGLIARFLENKLSVLVWHRSDRDSKLVFGAELNMSVITSDLIRQFQAPDTLDPALNGEVAVALLNDSGHAIAQTHPGFCTDWKHPLVAAEIGETLPHWEVAIALLDPNALKHTAQTVRLTVGLIIGLLVVAIAVGGWLIFLDLRRQIDLARQKTDFVSNVSHELKTPLTSIRVFSELLADGKIVDPEKQRSYLGIISTEAARLSRLINNVLDFARLDRGDVHYNFQRINLARVTQEAVAIYRPQLENANFSIALNLANESLPVQGDQDALSQILVNLLSNAEKYSLDQRSIEVTGEIETGGKWVCVRVMDRGTGIPKGCEEKIFEQFFRAHDSLSSGIQGSGLGLTLARQIARVHGGEILYAARAGGGSIFTLRLPLSENALHRSNEN